MKTKGAKFDPEIHVIRHELEERYGKKGPAITRTLRSEMVVAAGAIVERRTTGYADVPFWKRSEVVPLLDAIFEYSKPKQPYKGEIVKPAEVRKFKPLKLAKHPRMADIEAAQPPISLTMGGIGNGAERTRGFSRGI